ncbi:MAG: helix-turn-helix domain-containing protein [Pseudorhodoferax sp.]
MSFDAIKWALAQPVPKAAAKFVLVAIADCVNAETCGQEMVCWPSIAHICATTSLDRKTVIGAVKRLVEIGCLFDTGERKGVTAQVPVYRLNSTEKGTVKESQIRNSSENGTIPDFPGNSTEIPKEQSRFSVETVPKTGHGTTKEPGKEPGKKQRRAKSDFDPLSVELPEWLDAEAWAMWVKYRAAAKKPITEDAARLQIGKLTKFRGEGHDPKLVIEAAIENSWQGLYLPKDGSTRVGSGVQASPGGVIPPQWWKLAGFDTKADADNARCYWTNFTEFRDGKRIEVATA